MCTMKRTIGMSCGSLRPLYLFTQAGKFHDKAIYSVTHNIYISLNAPYLYIKNWPEDGSLEPKHVAKCVLMIIYVYMLCLTE